MSKILLISPCLPISRKSFFPENWFPPLGICYLSSVLKSRNHEVDILDPLIVYKNFSDTDSIDFEYAVQKIISNNRYDFVGISVLSHTRNTALRISKIIKMLSQKTIIILGGPYPSLMYKQLIHNYSDVIDAIVIGEGEDHILGVIDYFSNYNSNNYYKKPVNTAIFRSDKSPNNCIFISKYFPDYSAYSNIDYPIRNVSVIGSRGCLFNNCDYCSSKWIPYRERSIENIVQEIIVLFNTYKIEKVHFHDNTFTTNKNRTLKLFNEISNRSFPINFSMKTRLDCIDEDVISMFNKIGGKTISFGLETGSPELRNKLGKGISNSRIKMLTSIVKEYGLLFGVYILLGHPQETNLDIEMTIDFLQEILPDEVITSIVCLYPGTALYTRAINEGKMKEDDWLSDNICFTYADEARKEILFDYENTINNMFPRFNEWTEYSGLYKIRDKK